MEHEQQQQQQARQQGVGDGRPPLMPQHRGLPMFAHPAGSGDFDEAVGMSTDINLLSSEFNLMMASEEILRHVPLPEDAAAAGNMAWL